ncbi:MAG: MarR-like DNA-binding transcriptional regulator SgrR of sgrS sRNA, partial [Flavobacterium sp.]
MKEQKNIERLFQEKFKDFEVAPPEMAWSNIEARLNKKKRRIIPFWFKISGIAASLFLGFYIYSLFNGVNIKDKTDSSTTIVEEKNNSIQNQIDLKTIKANQNSKNSLSEQNNVITEVDNLGNKINTEKNILKKGKVNIVKPTENLLSFSKKNRKQKINIKFNQENQITKGFNKSNLIESESDEIKITANSNLVKNKIDFNKIKTVNKNENSSIVVAKKANNTTQDSSLVAKISEEVNALEQLLKEKEVGKNVEEKEKEMQDRWAVSSNASPVYFNSSSNGSPLDSKFESNE